MKVTLRTKVLSDGRESFYLDIYANGRRNYEFLNLYLAKAKNLADKDLNKESRAQAEHIRAKRQLELQASAHGYISNTKRKIDFLEHFKAETERRKVTGVDYSAWLSVQKHLTNFIGAKRPLLSDIDETWIQKFKDYLLHTAKKSNDEKLTQNSSHHYFNRIKNYFKKAYKDKLISDNPCENVPYITQSETKREFLTFEELQKLSSSECRYPVLKRAFLFSALTGLRWSDIQKLVWSEVQFSEQTGWGIYFRQQKTDNVDYLPISDQARSLLSELRGEPNESVFYGLKYSAYHNAALTNWCSKAGITKHITFHCARHTNATLLITNGVDIYTVSKLLGHRELQTTQIYAKLVNEKKIEAVNKLPLLKI